MATTTKNMNKFWRVGEPMVWISAAALAITLLTAIILLIVIMVNGLGVFWPSELQQLELKDGRRVNGQLMRTELTADGSAMRRQYKIANRDLYGLDFRWIDEEQILKEQRPEQLLVLERIEHGDFYGELKVVGQWAHSSCFTGAA